MSNDTVERRLFLRGAGLAGAAVLASTAVAPSASARGDDDDDDHGDVTGAWLITHRDDPGGDPTVVRGVACFADGGALVNQDIYPVSPAGVGSWKARHDNGFKGNFWTGFPSQGPGAPDVTANVKIRGKVDDDEISGTYTFTVFNAVSGTKVAEGTGTFEGKRIKA